MKVVVVGRGVTGSAVAELLEEKHEVVSVSRSSGELAVDARSLAQIANIRSI